MSYEVMDESLAQLTHENYGCEIMKCLQPTGRVQPHSIAQIPFLFSPLEAKTYAVKVWRVLFRDSTVHSGHLHLLLYNVVGIKCYSGGF